MSHRAADSLFASRQKYAQLRPAYDQHIVQVPITNISREQSKDFYLERDDHANIVKTLGELGVAAQFHDIIFSHPKDPAADALLAESISAAGDTYLGMALGVFAVRNERNLLNLSTTVATQLNAQSWNPVILGNVERISSITEAHLTMWQLAEVSSGLGFLDIAPDRDGVIRRVPLIARNGTAIFPSLSLRVISDFLQVNPDNIVVQPGHSVTLTAAKHPDWDQPRDVVIPVDHDNRMIVNYLGPWGSMKHYPYEVIVEASRDRFYHEDLRLELQGKIVLVSWVATGTSDIGSVPVDSYFPLSGVHANAMHTILTQSFLREVSLSGMLLPVYLPLMLLLLFASKRLGTAGLTAIAALLAVLYYVAAHISFVFAGVLLDIPGPLALLTCSTILLAAYQFHLESKSRAVLRSTFDAYFPPRLVDKAIAERENLVAAANKKELTILFSDIKDFTRLTESMDATKVRELLNEYFEQMIEIVFSHEGTLDKFIGDGLMVFFGDPQDQQDHALRCVRSALDMQKAARIISARWQANGGIPLEIRIGINTGTVIVGNMGSSKRLTYTALGEPVNLAQRVESNAPVGGILITRRTRDLLEGKIKTLERDKISVKGFSQPIEVFEVPIGQTD